MATPLGNLELQFKGQTDSGDSGYISAINGNWEKIDALFAIAGLDLQFGTLSNGDLLQYDTSISKWVNIDFTTADIASATTLSGHIDNEIDPVSTDTIRDKHLSNNDYKTVYDHTTFTTGNPHNITAAKVGNTVAQWNADQILGVSVDDTDIGTNKVLTYDGANLVYSVVNATQLNGYDLDFSSIADGYILTYESGNIVFTPQSGVSSFLTLSDVTDSNYTGKVGYVPKVNATATGLELGSISAGNVDGGDSSTVGDLITLRKDTETNWATNGATVIQNGNIALEQKTGGYWGKVGNGITAYSSLPYGILPYSISITTDKHKLQYNSSLGRYATVDDTLGNIRNVSIVSALNGQLLTYNNSTAEWENKSNLNSSVIKFADGSDDSKILSFNISGISTTTERTITMPDRNLTLDNVTTSTTSNITGLLKAEVEAVDGLVSVEDFLKATAQYEDENNTSKYKAGVLGVRAEVKAGKIKANWQEKTEATAKANPFDDTKVLKALLKLKPELVEVVGKIRAEIEAAKAE